MTIQHSQCNLQATQFWLAAGNHIGYESDIFRKVFKKGSNVTISHCIKFEVFLKIFTEKQVILLIAPPSSIFVQTLGIVYIML